VHGLADHVGEQHAVDTSGDQVAGEPLVLATVAIED
jgi:hypothetical protein